MILYVKILVEMRRTNKNSKRNYIVYTSWNLLALAMKEVANGLTEYDAPKKYKIPRKTLLFKTTGKNQIGKRWTAVSLIDGTENVPKILDNCDCIEWFLRIE